MQRTGAVSAAETSIRHLLPRRDFRRLLLTRLLCQFGDGVFQAALAGTVLFNPQRAADPIDVAAGFAVSGAGVAPVTRRGLPCRIERRGGGWTGSNAATC